MPVCYGCVYALLHWGKFSYHVAFNPRVLPLFFQSLLLFSRYSFVFKDTPHAISLHNPGMVRWLPWIHTHIHTWLFMLALFSCHFIARYVDEYIQILSVSPYFSTIARILSNVKVHYYVSLSLLGFFTQFYYFLQYLHPVHGLLTFILLSFTHCFNVILSFYLSPTHYHIQTSKGVRLYPRWQTSPILLKTK